MLPSSSLLWDLMPSSLASITCTFSRRIPSSSILIVGGWGSCSRDTSIKDFVDFSAMVETVGTSAYTGAAQLISDKVCHALIFEMCLYLHQHRH
jgi:hypothetical protein